jgi:hypothetical protein
MLVVDAIDSKIDTFWQEHLLQTDKAIERRRNVGRTATAVVVTIITAFAGEKVYAAYTEVPQFSPDTIQFVAENGDSLWTAATRVEGHNQVDITTVVSYIENMPENQAALGDGLQTHESIVIPMSVQP